MEYTAETPRTKRTIAGIELQVIQPFAEGQPLTAATAAMLNQTLAENFSNNTRKAITELGENPDVAKAQALLDEYMTKYQPGVRSSGSGEARVTDPVEREARKLARAKAEAHVISKGLKPRDVDMKDLTEKVFDKYRDQFMAGGKKVVAQLEAAKKAAGEFSLDDLEIADKPAEGAEPAPAEG